MQLPTHPSNARVKMWRRLQQVGAIALKGSLYVLPNSASCLEDLEWLRAEALALKGHASVFEASSVEGAEDSDIVDEFRRARDQDYKALANEMRRVQKEVKRLKGRDGSLARTVRQIEERLSKIRGIDFFSASARQLAETEFENVTRMSRPNTASVATSSDKRINRRDYQGRTWVTRPRPGIDRLSSAWLISRFIDEGARFIFRSDPSDAPDAVPFDMYEGGFGHEGAMCTFEVLLSRFHIENAGVRRLGELVHDLDLKDERYRVPQAAGVQSLVIGLQATFSDDDALLAQGHILFDALYRGVQVPYAASPRNKPRRNS